MKLYCVNAEYERVLFQDIVGASSEAAINKIRTARQYLFYFLNQDPTASLLASVELSNEVKDYYESLGIQLPKFKTEGPAINWYGKLSNLELERKLNSKLETYQMLSSLGELPANLFFVNSPTEIKEALKRSGNGKTWILKSPYSCGGTGVVIIRSDSDVPELLTHTHILEPYRERVLDMAVHYDHVTREIHPYISHIHQNGTYIGGRIYQNQTMIQDELKAQGLYDLFMRNVEKAKFYLKHLSTLPIEQDLTFDSFLYREGGSYFSYPLCEINYRTSMGTLNKNLRRFLPENGVGLLILFNNPQKTDWKTVMPYNCDTKTGIISLNEKNPVNEVLLLCAPNSKALNKLDRIVFDMNLGQ